MATKRNANHSRATRCNHLKFHCEQLLKAENQLLRNRFIQGVCTPQNSGKCLIGIAAIMDFHA